MREGPDCLLERILFSRRVRIWRDERKSCVDAVAMFAYLVTRMH